MKNKFLNFSLITVLILISYFFFVFKIQAQESCTIQNANFSSNGILPDFLNSGGNISIFVKTNNCAGKTILLTVFGTHEHWIRQAQLAGQLTSPLDVSGLHNKSITVPNSENFRINLIASEESCIGRDSFVSTLGGETYYAKYDCAYYFEFGGAINFSSIYSLDGGIIYNCLGECEDQQKPWSFISTIELKNDNSNDTNNNSVILNNNTNTNTLHITTSLPTDLSTKGLGLTAACPKNGCGFNELLGMINKVIKFIIFDLAVPIAAIMFAYAGIILLTSGGNETQKGKAKKIFGGVAIGLVVAAAAWLIIETILKTLGYDGSWIGF